MSDEIQQLVDAIKSIKPEDNYIKDYIFPALSALFSSLLGGAVAYFTFKHQDAILFEKEKMLTTNKWTILSLDTLNSLQAIKGNYFEKLTEDPIQRALTVPTIIGQYTRISESIVALSFISPKEKNGKQEYIKWSQIPLIQTLFYNYNHLLGIWEKRNELDHAIKLQLIRKYSSGAHGMVNEAMIMACIDPTEFGNLIDLTEKAIRLTDDLIIELDDFLCNFSSIAETKIKTKKLKDYGSILKYKHTFDSRKYLQKSVPANYELITNLMGLSAEDLELRYKTGYEVLL